MCADTCSKEMDPLRQLAQSSTPEMNRKASKPLMEKRRRARINASLNQLKVLVLEAFKKDSARYSKLEKSDILELTVKHLKNIQRQHLNVAMATDPGVATRFQSGYTECAKEVGRYLSSIDSLDEAVRVRLLRHLASCTQRVCASTDPFYPAQPLYVHIPKTAPAVPQASMYLPPGVQGSSPLEAALPSRTQPAHYYPCHPGSVSCSPVYTPAHPLNTTSPSLESATTLPNIAHYKQEPCDNTYTSSPSPQPAPLSLNIKKEEFQTNNTDDSLWRPW